MLHCIRHFTTIGRRFQFTWPVPNMRTKSGRQYQRRVGDLSVISLDLANAYESVYPSLIEEAMCHFWIPKPVQRMTIEYYNKYKMRFTTKDFTTDWQRFENNTKTENKAIQTPLRAFRDDIFISSKLEKAIRGPLERLYELI